MGDAAINSKALEDAMLKALSTLFPSLLGTTNNPRAEFYNKFQREADQHDDDFLKKYGGDLDNTLIFAGLFSAVTSAFIVDVRTQIQTDFTQLTYNVTATMAKVNLGLIASSEASVIEPSPPDPTLVRVQAILFSSLVVSLLAAFVAMLGKQWLTRYSQVDMHGSLIDRSRDRQRKMNGMTAWRFSVVMESLPLLLQASLLLLGCALTAYFHTIDNVDPWVIAGFTIAGFLFYLLIVVAGSLSYDCPFQTPISLLVHFLTDLNDKRKRRKKANKHGGWLLPLFFKKKQRSPPPRFNSICMSVEGGNPDDHMELTTTDPHDVTSLVLFDSKEVNLEGCVLDSNCIEWMFDRSMDEEVILDIMDFIPEVVWHDGIQTTPLQRLYDIVIECFDNSSGRPVLIPRFRKKAYLSAKALLHVAICRKYIGTESDAAVFQSISRRYQILGTHRDEGDSDLESTLCMVDRVFKDSDNLGRMRWEEFSFTDPHRAWMSHILVYRASYILKKNAPLPDDIKEFVLHSLRTVPPPPVPVILDCLRIIGSVIRMPSQHVTDASGRLTHQIRAVYRKLAQTFGEQNPTHHDIDCALEAMKLIAPLSHDDIAARSYHLFGVVMGAGISPAYSKAKRWEAARLALHGAYKWDKVLPFVKDPQVFLDFLTHHFELQAKGENHDEPIQNTLRALAYANNQTTIDGLNAFDTTQESFIHGICSAFQDGRPPQLRKAALFLLPLIGDRWFNAPDAVMGDDRMSALCADWFSTVEENRPADNLHIQRISLTVLLHMMNSAHWRGHIPKGAWRLLEHFNSLSEDPAPMRRCLENQQLVSAILDQDGIYLWSTILWLRYKDLTPEVRQQLATITRGSQRKHIDIYQRAMDDASIDAEDKLTEYTTWSADPKAVSLRVRIESIREAKTVLAGLRRG